jgi:hypothetical protein
MAAPFTLIVAGVNSNADILARPAVSATTTPYVDLRSFNLTLSGDGNSSSMSFDVIQQKTPVGGPWWKSGGVNDNARVQFFDSRYSGSVPLFLGYVTNIDAVRLANGLGTRATVSVASAEGWLEKTIIRRGTANILATSMVDSFSIGDDTSTDQDIINGLLKKVNALVTDATTQQLLDTSIISGSTRAVFSGSAQTIGKQTFKATTLLSALDQVAEEAAGVFGARYRYWINGSGRLNYGPVTASPTYANAPAEIVTDPATTATGSTSVTTKILARDLAVTLDHDRIVKGIFVQADTAYARYDSNQTWPTAPTNDPYFRTYDGTYSRNGAGLTARTGALPHEVYSAPKITQKSDRGVKIGRLARATMTSLGQPVRTVSFSVAGANLSQTSAPDWSYGYSQGYALTALATYTLVKAWLPDQYVKVTDSVLNLSAAIMRIASVSMRFETGDTFQVRYDIEADFRRQRLGKIGIIGGE